MSLIGRLIGSLLSQGQITIVMPDEKRHTYGPGGGRSLTVRITDRKVVFELLRNPRLAIGETYMNGRLIIDAMPASAELANRRILKQLKADFAAKSPKKR